MDMKAAVLLAQPLLLILAAPLVSGFVKKLKAILQNRRGASVFQPYWDMLKNLRKEEVVSETTSWIFRCIPYVAFAATAAACFLIPVVAAESSVEFAGDLIALVYLLALPRFFMALGGLDAGSAFGGMGSSREMMIASTAEPALMMALFTAAVETGTTRAGQIAATLIGKGWVAFSPGATLAFAALFLVALAECGRLPVDNPATHLELTMVHEAMILEHSGRSLALIEWASAVKLTLFLTLLGNLFIPWGMALDYDVPSLALGLMALALKIAVFIVTLALAETSTAKLRLFRVPDFLGAAFVLALLGLLSQGVLNLGL